MFKCKRCGVPIGLLSMSTLCPDCQKIADSERKKREAAEREAETKRRAEEREAEKREQEVRETARRNRVMELAKQLKRRVEAGEAVHFYESVYLPVNSRVVDDDFPGFDIAQLRTLGASGWEVVAVVPRTLGIALTNVSYGSSAGQTWGAGVGGNVIGVHVVLRMRILQGRYTDRMLVDYTERHLEELEMGESSFF